MATATSTEYGYVLSASISDNGDCVVLVQLNSDPPGAPPHRVLEPAGDLAAWQALVGKAVLVTLQATG